MKLSEKLVELRRRQGLSQEQLAEQLGVTRQSVSKWESGAAVPEVGKLVALSEQFSVSVDYLVKDWLEEPAAPLPEHPPAMERLEAQMGEISRLFQGYAYDSRRKLFGLPLLSVRLNRCRGGFGSTAKGIIAIGNSAVGVVAIGGFGVGLVSLSATGLGLLSLGVVAGGLAALGVVAFGGAAFGVCAVGVYACGVSALGVEAAVGLAAAGKTVVARDGRGLHMLQWAQELSREAIEAFLEAHCPNLRQPLLKLLAVLGEHILNSQ